MTGVFTTIGTRDHAHETVVRNKILADQGRIIAKVDQLMDLVDKLEAQLTASRATADQLLSALVAALAKFEAKDLNESDQ